MATRASAKPAVVALLDGEDERTRRSEFYAAWMAAGYTAGSRREAYLLAVEDAAFGPDGQDIGAAVAALAAKVKPDWLRRD